MRHGTPAALHDGRAQLPQQAPQLRVQLHALAWWLVQGDAIDVSTLQAQAEVGDLGQRDHHMPVGIGRHVVDQVDDAVLQTSGVEAVEDMGNERRQGPHRRQSRQSL
jgi:hypothetical protein